MIIKKTAFSLVILGIGFVGTDVNGMCRIRNMLRGVNNFRRPIVGASTIGSLAYKAASPATNADDAVDVASQPRFDLFKKVQAIIAVAESVKENKERDGKLDSGQTNWPGANFYYARTQDGLYFRLDGHPRALGSPWGEVRLIGGGGYSTAKRFKEHLNVEFFKRVALEFELNICDVDKDSQLPLGTAERVERVKFYKTNPTTYETTEISKEDLRSFKGSNAIITANYCGCDSIYKVIAVDGNKVPELQHLPEGPLHPAIEARIKTHGRVGIMEWLESAKKADPSIDEFFNEQYKKKEIAREAAKAEWNTFSQCYRKAKAKL